MYSNVFLLTAYSVPANKYFMTINSNPEAIARFIKKIESFAQIPDKEFDHLTGIMHKKHFKKGEVILKEGQVCKEYYFIFNGSIRSYCMKDGREVNVHFYFEDDIACNFESFREEMPSTSYLLAMEHCIVYYTAKEESAPFFLNESSMHILLFRFFQQLFFDEEAHSSGFKLLSPQERYAYLLQHKPQYLQRVPMIHLASYMGVSRETLNRIRKKNA
jgi:CRP-like cAMP-binding protein